MKFTLLFDLNLKHSYYADGKCLDFSISPTPSTATMLRNHRCVPKSRPDGITILITVDEQGKPFIPIPQETAFTFQLHLQNSDFPLFTDLTQFTTQDTFKKIIYPVKASLGNDVFATVNIYNFFQKISEEPAIREISFVTKQSRWTYYFITDLSDGGAVFRIIDTDASNSDLFPDSNQIDLNQNPDASDSVATILSKQYPAMKRLRFVSGGLIPCRQVPRKNLQLRLGDSKIFEHLPNPSYRNCSRMNVDVNGNLQQHDTLFQIVKYITDPSLTKV